MDLSKIRGSVRNPLPRDPIVLRPGPGADRVSSESFITTDSSADEAEQDAGEEAEIEEAEDANMRLVEAAKVERWRSEWGMQADEDFAFAFSDYAEALAKEGGAVADAWYLCRMVQTQYLAFEAGRAMAADSAASAATEAAVVGITPKPPTRGKPSGVSTRRTQEAEDPKRNEAYIPALVQCMQECGALSSEKVSGEDLMSALTRRATKSCAESEEATLRRATMTWSELRAHCKEAGIEPAEMTAVQLEVFVYKSQAKSRAFVAVRWLAKNLGLRWATGSVMPPATKARNWHGMDSNQAITAEPCMIQALEVATVMAFQNGEPGRLGLLASWLQAMGCVRLAHLKRSIPLKQVDGFLWFHCHKGKQRHARAGFQWGAPSIFLDGFQWADSLIREWVSLTGEDKKRLRGVVYDTGKKEVLTNDAVIQLAIEAVHTAVEGAANVTTYTWRRVLPTIGTWANFQGVEQLALGDWQDHTLVKEGNLSDMPLRYSGNKGHLSQAVKLRCHHILTNILTEDIDTFMGVAPAKWVSLAKESVGVLSEPLGTKAIWQNPELFDRERLRRFYARKRPATKPDGWKEEFESDGVRGRSDPRMPNSIYLDDPKKPGDYLLSRTTRDRLVICPAFSIGGCTEELGSTPRPGSKGTVTSCRMGIHVCAILLRGGRVCGMPNHGAHKCRMIERAIQAEQLQFPKRAREDAGGGASSAERPSKARKMEVIPSEAPSASSTRSTQQQDDVVIVAAKPAQRGRAARRKAKVEQGPDHPLPIKEDSAGTQEAACTSEAAREGIPAELREALDARRSRLKEALEAKTEPQGVGSEERREDPKAQDASALDAPAVKAEGSRPGVHWDALFDSLAAGRQDRAGNRLEPEKPTLVAKVCAEPGRGELWLGGIPRRDKEAELYEGKRLNIQICCMAKPPREIVIDPQDKEQGMRGCVVNGCIIFKLELSHEGKRMEDWRNLSGRVVSSIRSGDNGLIHCIGGTHRAPVGAAMLRAVLHGESFDDAKKAIEAVRKVDFHKSLQRFGGPWIEKAIHGPWNNKAHVVPYCWAAGVGASIVHACRKDGDKLGPVCKWNQRDALSFFKTDMLQAGTVEEARSWGRNFCTRCTPWLRCSVEARMLGWRG